MRRTITALILAAFIGVIFANVALAATATKKPATTKATSKAAKAKPKPAATAKPMSKTAKGMAKGMGKANKFLKRTFTAPQKHPKARKPNHNRKDSNLAKGVKTSAHKAGKWIKGRTKLK